MKDEPRCPSEPVKICPGGGRGPGVDPFAPYRSRMFGEEAGAPGTLRKGPTTAAAGSDGVDVLVVEDDAALGAQLQRGLTRAGYEPRLVDTAAAALADAGCDLVLLDLGLPDLDGMEVCRRLRTRGRTPIIVITARGEEADRVMALDLGADDYLVKPFGIAELLARIRAVLRRSQPGGSEQLRCGPLLVDLRARRVRMHGEEVALTPKEFDVLACLADDPGRALSRQEILERAWGTHWYGPSKSLDVHVAALRRKLAAPDLIETVYGMGYRLAPPVQAAR